MKNSFFSIKSGVSTELEIKKSRFICDLEKVSSDEEAKAFIKKIKQKYSDARHNCYAYIADSDGAYMKYSDDGEPSGTAGLPMLEVLKGKGLYCVTAVVTRYFGGILLGTGGLARAYSDSVVNALEKSKIVENVLSETLTVNISFNLYKPFLKWSERKKLLIKGTEFTADGATLILAIPAQNSNEYKGEIVNLSLGKAIVNTVGINYEIYE